MTCIATTIPAADEANQCPPPTWARDLISHHATEDRQVQDSITLCRQSNGRYSLITAQLAGAAEMNDDEFRSRTTECYAAISASLDGFAPARFWNHIPNIHASTDGNLDRYMVFNAGRYDAFLSWYGTAVRFDTQVATASGIGHHGTDLIVHCLATDRAVSVVDNPRQIRPYHYSARFGPQPPCFARATRVDHLLFVGGTASVRGEDSAYPDDLARQTEETISNLDSLLGAAGHREKRAAFRELRVYHPHLGDAEWIVHRVRDAFPNLRRLEMMQADLCRRELLVEIEGLADL